VLEGDNGNTFPRTSRTGIQQNGAATRLHRDYLLNMSGWKSDPRVEAELDFLRNEGMLVTNEEFLRRESAGLPLDPFDPGSD
jgi:hypothetical protein